MLKTGVTSVSFRDKSVEEIIAAVAAAGLQGIEWGSDVHVPAGDLPRARAVRQKTEAAGLEVLSYGAYYRLGASRPEEFDKIVASAAALGVRDVRIWGGSKNSADCTPAVWQALVEEARALAEKAAKQGLVLSLECHNLTVTDEWPAALRFLKEVGSPAFAMYWQPNQLKTEGYNLAAAQAEAPFVTNIHVFSWEADKRLELAAHNARWQKYLTFLCDGRPHALILEFMPDDRIETLAREAHLLCAWVRGFEETPPAEEKYPPLVLLPAPQRLSRRPGTLTLDKTGYILFDDRALFSTVRLACPRYLAEMELALLPYAKRPAVTVKKEASLPAEGYRLTVEETGVTLEYADAPGLFYGFATLNQLLELDACRLPCLEITDWPDFAVRGYMLDIGRNRVPKNTEMFALADKLAAWKINHLELYIEGVPFTYRSFEKMWQGKELLTGEDIMALDEYCRARFIELVPTQNNFGHMDLWLKKEFRSLAECPDGFQFGGSFLPDPRCLNPGDPASLGLVRHLADDLLPYFSGDKYNVCCDETLELGQGASKEECERRGMQAVYADFVVKVCEVARAHGRHPLLWDDIIRSYPEEIRRLPKDAVLLDWGYDASQPSEEDCCRLEELGREYYVCPGTAAWNCYLGKTDQMLANIARAARLGLAHGAKGLLNTDWGDAGHLQNISSSYAGIAYGAAMAWCPAKNEELDLAAALDAHVFFDREHRMGRFVLDAGRYDRYEGKTVGNVTQSMWLLFINDEKSVEEIDEASFDRVTAYLEGLAPALEAADLQCADAVQVKAEYRHALRLVSAAQLLGHAFKAKAAGDGARETEYLRRFADAARRLELESRRLWLARCRQSMLEDSMQQFRTLYGMAEARLAELEKKDEANHG